jgi:hypothetical protein
MRRLLLHLFAAAALFQAGCPYYVYEIRMEPQPEGLRRTVTVRHSGRQSGSGQKLAPDPNVERLAQLYSERLTKGSEERQIFRGTFADKLPADVGGAGTYRRIDTPLGSAYWYTERFRGADDLDAELFARRAAADRLADLTVGWFDEQMRDSPHHAAVRRFLHQEFRQDLRNLVVYLWDSYRPKVPGGDADERPSLQALRGPLAGVVAFLNERGYFDPPGALSLARLQGDDGPPLRELRRLLARKAKLPADEADRAFPFLVDPAAVRASLAAWLRKTPEYDLLRKSWKPDPSKPEVSEPDPLEVLNALAIRAFDPTFLVARDRLSLTLSVPIEPYATNGEYLAREGVVGWNSELPTTREMPYICIAAWSVPDDKAQTAFRGKVYLEKENLASFAVLYAALPAERRKEFADYVELAKRDESARARADDFRFAEPIDDSTRETLARLFKLLLP